MTHSDELLFIRLTKAIKNNTPIILLKPTDDGFEICESGELVSDLYIHIGKFDSDNIDADNMIPLSVMERILELELIEEDSVVCSDRVDKTIDRFYHYIKHLRT